MAKTEMVLAALQSVLFRAVADGPPGALLYMVLDAAHDPLIHQMLIEYRTSIEARSLYQGDIGVSLADVSPYLLRLRDAEDKGWSLVAAGQGRSWGCFIIATGQLEDVRRHLRKFNIVYREDATPLVFRFHDPRVLRRFLPLCTTVELRRFFGPIDAFIAELDEADALVRFTFRGDNLITTQLPSA